MLVPRREVIALRTYEFWRERSNGEVWAIRLLDGIVVGCCGPLAARELDVSYLSGLDYSAERAEWVEEHRDAFDLCQPAPIHA